MKRQSMYVAAAIAATTWVGSMLIMPATVRADNAPVTETSTTEVQSGVSSLSAQVKDLQPQITYSVKPGDYLESIAESFHLSWPSVYQANPAIQNPDTIYPNQQLDIPDQDIPLTRSLPATTLSIPDSYQPKPLAASSKAVVSTTASVASVSMPSGGGVLGYAYAMVGKPYVYGGTTPAGFDCSGLTQYLAAQRGISLPRTALAQYSATRREGLADVQPGDLIFFNAHHVGMYVGNGNVIHATVPGRGVQIDSLKAAIAYNGYMGAGALGH